MLMVRSDLHVIPLSSRKFGLNTVIGQFVVSRLHLYALIEVDNSINTIVTPIWDPISNAPCRQNLFFYCRYILDNPHSLI